jgi:hypothetical protein
MKLIPRPKEGTQMEGVLEQGTKERGGSRIVDRTA